MFNRINLILCRIKYRNKCILGKDSVLYSNSNILNCSNDNKRIVIGNNTHIKGEIFVFAHGGKVVIGEYCYIGDGARIWSSDEIFIGDRVLISHNVNIFDSNTHPLSSSARHQQFKDIISSGHPKDIYLHEKKVKIENGVLIGCMAIVLKGVTIGEGAIVGAGSVVTKDVPPWTIVVGNPARIVREIPEYER